MFLAAVDRGFEGKTFQDIDQPVSMPFVLSRWVGYSSKMQNVT